MIGSISPMPNDGHNFTSGQAPHAGFLEWQILLPCQIIRWERLVHSFCGISAPTSCSTFTGSIDLLQPNLRDNRPKWVSTVIPGISKACPKTTFAVFRPTPGSFTSSSCIGGTFPLKSASKTLAKPLICFAFDLKKPVDLMIRSRSRISAFAKSFALLYFLKRTGVTWFTQIGRAHVWTSVT